MVTVSKALAGKPGVGEELREKILALAKNMDYTPLRKKGRGGKSSRSSCNIGILVAERFFEDKNFYADLYRQVLLACHTNGFSTLLEPVTPEAEALGTMPTILQGKKVDGLIFMGELGCGYLRHAIGFGLPYVMLDFYQEGIPGHTVTSDNVEGGCRLTCHLLSCGRREIGFVGSICGTSSIMDRFLGYVKALTVAGIPLRRDWVIEDRDKMGLLLESLPLPEEMPRAFVCSCDEVALRLVEQLRRRGLRVPEDVAVAGYDNIRLAQLCTPPLTSYHVDVKNMGQQAVALLVDKIDGKDIPPCRMVVPGKLVCREST